MLISYSQLSFCVMNQVAIPLNYCDPNPNGEEFDNSYIFPFVIVAEGGRQDQNAKRRKLKESRSYSAGARPAASLQLSDMLKPTFTISISSGLQIQH